MTNIQNILKDSNYSLSIFKQKFVDELEKKITIKNDKPYIECLIREKKIILKPEEVVRHMIINHDLHNHDGELPDSMAEHFIQWEKREKLSFWE